MSPPSRTAQSESSDPRAPETTGLVERAVGGNTRAVARLISLVEDGAPQLREAMAALAPHVSGARIIGLTGPPGVGKSTTVSALAAQYRKGGARVGVLAVDPSSPFSGGALLGDRVRMQEHATDDGVFIRSMSSRGHLGGLAWSTPQALRILDAAGCEVILLETVGVGQSEVEIAGLADTTVVLVAPGMGDAVQAAKAGVLEVGDVYVVNKADRDGASATVRDLRGMLSLGERRQAGDWRPPVVSTVAERGDGLSELLTELDNHRVWLEASGGLLERRRLRTAAELTALARAALLGKLEMVTGRDGGGGVIDAVLAGKLDPYAAADQLVTAVMKK